MFIYYLFAAAIIIIDQLTKWIVVQQMELRESIPVIENFFYITSHRNTGAAWGILQGQMWFFYIITIIVIGVIIYYMKQYAKASRFVGTALALILAGAIGNFIDRVFRKEVVDFLDVYLGSYNYPIFNVADSALVVGVIFVMIATFVDERKKKGSTAK
ncbi:lipoprotein signal peptidase [Halobacillus andaensis]|uniref:Lipoprotein signal peptidase n=1 Tax=Halobacillus andaensis TaxID=1176239 RepID=A0A917AZ78_HALAA|nr:signal peptidase II [Halobacillus andaensis]MBP2003564.1 signal peptidase II [Halobacillus andaensis]GGF11599.1 lipoprotein signal peptidase [Halobacillus andaensis]